MPRRLLRERTNGRERSEPFLAARGVVAVHERRERIERHVLGEREPEREPARLGVGAAAHRVEREPEDGAVDGVERETCRAPRPPARDRLAEERDVGVVVAEEPAVVRL